MASQNAFAGGASNRAADYLAIPASHPDARAQLVPTHAYTLAPLPDAVKQGVALAIKELPKAEDSSSLPTSVANAYASRLPDDADIHTVPVHDLAAGLGVNVRTGLDDTLARARLGEHGSNKRNSWQSPDDGLHMPEWHEPGNRRVRVFRNTSLKQVNTKDIVVGDVLFLDASTTCPADARVLVTSAFRSVPMPAYSADSGWATEGRPETCSSLPSGPRGEVTTLVQDAGSGGGSWFQSTNMVLADQSLGSGWCLALAVRTGDKTLSAARTQQPMKTESSLEAEFKDKHGIKLSPKKIRELQSHISRGGLVVRNPDAMLRLWDTDFLGQGPLVPLTFVLVVSHSPRSEAFNTSIVCKLLEQANQYRVVLVLEHGVDVNKVCESHHVSEYLTETGARALGPDTFEGLLESLADTKAIVTTGDAATTSILLHTLKGEGKNVVFIASGSQYKDSYAAADFSICACDTSLANQQMASAVYGPRGAISVLAGLRLVTTSDLVKQPKGWQYMTKGMCCQMCSVWFAACCMCGICLQKCGCLKPSSPG